MARALWTGSLSFGLVNVPVALVSAVRDRGVHFRQLHERDDAPIDTRRYCGEEDREVPYDEIVAGYELDDGRWVTLNDDELAAAEPRKTRTIDIDEFVELADVDPVYFDHPYFLVPTGGEGPLRAYRLLVEVMERTQRAALGRFVLRTKEYLVAIRARHGALALTTMLFADEVRSSDGIRGARAGKARRKAVEQATQLIGAMSRDFEPSRYRDCHRERLLAIVERKRAGERITAPPRQQQPQKAPDLIAALEESLARAKGRAQPAREDLGERTKDELLEQARELEIAGRSKMSKDELVAAISADA